MSESGGVSPERLFQDLDIRPEDPKQERGLKGQAIDKRTQNAVFRLFCSLDPRYTEVEVGDEKFRINVRSAQKFILAHAKQFFPQHAGKTSLTKEEIKKCIRELRERQKAAITWKSISASFHENRSVYETLGLQHLFRTNPVDPRPNVDVFRKLIEKQCALLPNEKMQKIDRKNLLIGNLEELGKLEQALDEEFKNDTERGRYIADLLYGGNTVIDKANVLQRTRAFREAIETMWKDFSMNKNFFPESADPTLLLEKALRGEDKEALEQFKKFYKFETRPSP